MPCGKNMKGCHKRCLHRSMVLEYHDARDARDALREQGEFMQMEDDDFDEQVPKVTFKAWLQGMRQ